MTTRRKKSKRFITTTVIVPRWWKNLKAGVKGLKKRNAWNLLSWVGMITIAWLLIRWWGGG